MLKNLCVLKHMEHFEFWWTFTIVRFQISLFRITETGYFPNEFCKNWALWHLWPLKCISNRAFNAIDAHHHLLGGPFFVSLSLENRKNGFISWGQYYGQSHDREFLRWEILMEQELRFGLDLGRLAVMKKKGSAPIMSNFWGFFFHVFRGKKNAKFFFKTL